MIQAHFDKATATQEHDGVHIDVAGWAFAEQGHILVVQAWGNDLPLGFILYGFLRPDVMRHFKSRCHSERVGFEGRVKLPQALAGADVVELKLTLTSSELARHEITKSLSVKAALAAAVTEPAADTHDAAHAPGKHPPQDGWFPKRSSRLAPPDFFILGAGKCGTTSLYYSLRQHPEIHLSPIKEPSFFSTGFQVVKNPVEYFNLFPQQEGKKRYGEASHVYFSTPETAPVLRQLFPEAKFLLIVRNPVQRSHSLYQDMKRGGYESLPTFEQALREEEFRFVDPAFQADCPQYFWNFMYYRSSRYDLQLENYLEHFPRERFLVLTLGEWKADPAYWLREIFGFLEVDPSTQVGTEPQNQAEKPATLREETKDALRERFAGVRERVEALVGRELKHWDY
ncbi:sulfotransferase domain-containing protein [Roseimicrobium gellanilyticum]|uniref:Sulfotransferase domain-containing protein n=1 Tax=Roseimicrobium gellanilyticum TaxID=748857 RepID=A0A366HBZ0_9BACT|nr:sulfotransferase domain-containing protein [Roseimicrobium gellanilyticum]RBP39043.1 sulfotransferase domain-containing protein [Roseimicrobium gellanilyticum]